MDFVAGLALALKGPNQVEALTVLAANEAVLTTLVDVIAALIVMIELKTWVTIALVRSRNVNAIAVKANIFSFGAFIHVLARLTIFHELVALLAFANHGPYGVDANVVAAVVCVQTLVDVHASFGDVIELKAVLT